MNFELVWQELESRGAPDASGYVQRRLAPSSGVDLFLAVKKPANQRMLLLFLDRTSMRSISDLPAGRGVETRITGLAQDDTRIALEVALTDSRFADVFDALISDVVVVAGDKSGATAVASIIDRLQRWQRFLEAHFEGLGTDAERGLYAELWFLRRFLLEWLTPAGAISAWTGPLATNQDFQLRGGAIEVKSSVTKQLQSMRISNERQLDATGVGRLFLFHLSLDIRQEGGESLPGIIDALGMLLANEPAASDLLEDKLLQVGFLDHHRHQYERRGYTPRDWHFFEVTDEFPRILEQDLRRGVGDVRYSISVAECRHFSVKEADVRKAFSDG